MFGLCG